MYYIVKISARMLSNIETESFKTETTVAKWWIRIRVSRESARTLSLCRWTFSVNETFVNQTNGNLIGFFVCLTMWWLMMRSKWHHLCRRCRRHHTVTISSNFICILCRVFEDDDIRRKWIIYIQRYSNHFDVCLDVISARTISHWNAILNCVLNATISQLFRYRQTFQ